MLIYVFQVEDPVCSKYLDTDMVRNSNTKPVSTRRKLCRLNKGGPRANLGLYANECHSFSDSELERSTSMTSEFLDLPRRLSVRSTSPLLYCLDPEKLYLDLKTDHQKTCNVGARERSNTEPPRVQVSNIEVIVDNIDEDTPQETNMYLDNYSSYGDDEFVSRGSGVWINLEPRKHTLLSPRSSNGSICSFRSSNADSAIEMLTPDEELPEQPLADTSAAEYNKLWETQHRHHSDDLHIPGSYTQGAKSSCEPFQPISTTASSSLPSPSSSSAFFLNTSTTSIPSSNISSSTMTQQLYATSLQESTQGEQLAIATPSVVISDFSSRVVQDKGSQTLQTDLDKEYNSDLLGDRVIYNRSLSSSSISSESSLSIFSDSSDVADLTDFPIKLKPKVSTI